MNYKKVIRCLTVAVATSAGALHAQTGTLLKTYTLPDTPIGEFQNSVLPGTISNDHGFLLGSIGSGLYRSFLEGSNVYWMVTDRGPNPFNAANQRTFPLAGWTPWLLKVRTEGTSIEILQKVPLTLPGGSVATTGLPNNSRDEIVRQCDVSVPDLPFNPNGLDTEDLVRTLDGNFWLVDEHTPSLIKVLPNGQVSKRLLPQGLIPTLPGINYPVNDTIPKIYGEKRKQNRGFEGVTLGFDFRTIYAALQSPLVNPTAAAGNASRNTRILAMDAYSEAATAEYVYRFQPVTEFGHTNPAEMKVSALAMLDPWRMLVLERTDTVAKIYRVDLTKATNILGTQWDQVATAPSLEQLDEAGLEAANVKVLPKELILDLSTIPGIPDKIEGLTIIDFDKIAISNDNDFDVGPATCGTNVGIGTKNKVMVIKLNKVLFF